MASWNDIYGPNYIYNEVPEWMSTVQVETAASQAVRHPYTGHQSNYEVFWDPYAPQNLGGGPPFITMVLKVPICCEGCEEKAKSWLIDIDGVESVSTDQLQQKVTVSGTAPKEDILKACEKLFKRSNWRPSG